MDSEETRRQEHTQGRRHLPLLGPKEGFLKLNSVLRLKPIAANGSFFDLEEDGKLVIKALWELLKPIVEKKHLEKMMQAEQKDTVGLIEIDPIPTDTKEGLKLFLKLRREGERQEIRK